MNKEFLQVVCDELVERRLFAAFFDLRNFDLTEKRIKELQKKVRRDIYLDSAIRTGQDPNELKEMVLASFDKAMIKMKERISELYDKVIIPQFEKIKASE